MKYQTWPEGCTPKPDDLTRSPLPHELLSRLVQSGYTCGHGRDRTDATKRRQNQFSEVVDKVEREHERVVITKHGRPAAVVVSVDDLESLEQTLDILSRPALIKAIRESLDDLRDEGARVLSKDEALALISRS